MSEIDTSRSVCQQRDRVTNAGKRPEPGLSTAAPLNVEYRVSRFAQLIAGRWLDLGCADGGYSAELLRQGADKESAWTPRRIALPGLGRFGASNLMIGRTALRSARSRQE